jgi:hypothetical protein
MNEQQFNNLLYRAFGGRTAKVLAAVDVEPGLVHRADNAGYRLLHWASMGGHADLIQGLLERKADIHARTLSGSDAIMLSAMHSRLPALTLLFTSGADMTATDTFGQNALMRAALNNSLECAVYLLSRGCDLRLVDNVGQSAIDLYGMLGNISDEVKEQHRQILRDAFAEGPHISQIRRRAWLRRLPFLHFGAGCGFQPLAARRAAELASNPPLPPDAAIPAELNETPEQQRALLRRGVFGNEGIFKTITSFI